MKVKGKDLIITDPCYIAKDADWGESFNWEDYCIEPFSEYEWEVMEMEVLKYFLFQPTTIPTTSWKN